MALGSSVSLTESPEGIPTDLNEGMKWIKWMAVIGFMFFAFGLAQNLFAPLFGNIGSLLGLDSGQNTGPIQFGDP